MMYFGTETHLYVSTKFETCSLLVSKSVYLEANVPSMICFLCFTAILSTHAQMHAHTHTPNTHSSTLLVF